MYHIQLWRVTGQPPDVSTGVSVFSSSFEPSYEMVVRVAMSVLGIAFVQKATVEPLNGPHAGGFVTTYNVTCGVSHGS
jgi:hypothetical protein